MPLSSSGSPSTRSASGSPSARRLHCDCAHERTAVDRGARWKPRKCDHLKCLCGCAVSTSMRMRLEGQRRADANLASLPFIFYLYVRSLNHREKKSDRVTTSVVPPFRKCSPRITHHRESVECKRFDLRLNRFLGFTFTSSASFGNI